MSGVYNTPTMMPTLQTNECERLLQLEQQIIGQSVAIEQWFRSEWRDHEPPIYGSVDLRNACFKLAPVDTNLFPGGFNNLSEAALPVAVQAMMVAGEAHCPGIRRVLLVPENHTRNLYYLRNVLSLADILRQAGFEVRIGSLIPDLQAPLVCELPEDPATGSPAAQLLLEPVVREGDRLTAQGFNPCLVLLNNDLSGGISSLLQGLSGQVVIPPLHAGWATRKKSLHFAAYHTVAREFAQQFGIDPWQIDTEFDSVSGLDFHARAGEDELAEKVDVLLQKIRGRYSEYGISKTPFVVVKADAGTYGMGIMMVKDAAEVRGLNRKQRNKMSVVKDGLQVSDVILQEGVHSFEVVQGRDGPAMAEPVVYMIDRFVVGGFYRVHSERGPDENLNAPGAHFVPLPFEQGCQMPRPEAHPDATRNRLYLYGVIARLALLAGSRELEVTHPLAASPQAIHQPVV